MADTLVRQVVACWDDEKVEKWAVGLAACLAAELAAEWAVEWVAY